MENFFEQATDELTQDSFICWLILNFDDSEVGNESKKFIKFLWGNDLDVENLKKVKIDRQYKHIDIIVNLLIKDKWHCLIIEDKTNSCEHSGQLKTYQTEVEGWSETKDGRPTRYIYFKTGEIQDRDLKGMEGTKFEIRNLKDIWEHFKGVKTNSEILLHYVSYINKLYKDRTEEPANIDVKNWSFENWKLFFINNIAPQYENVFTYDYFIYQGRYLSICLYFANWRDLKQSTCLELFFRKNDKINANIHPFNCDEKPNSWRRDRSPEICNNVDNNFPIGSQFFKHFGKTQTLAALKKKIDKTNRDEILKEINNLIDDYLNNFKRFNF